MKLFTRCRMLANIFTVLAVILAIVLGINLFELGENLQLVSDDTNRWLLFFVAGCVLLLVLVLLVIALRCVVKDAEEDISVPGKIADKSAENLPNS